MVKNNLITVSGAVVFKDYRGKRLFLVVKQKPDGEWEIPKVTVRKGESSVRASIRLTGEQAGMNARVLEEAGRFTGSSTINGKVIPQKYYYYLLMQKSGGEAIGFQEYKWMEYPNAYKALSLKREKSMLRSARDVLKTWEKNRRKKG